MNKTISIALLVVVAIVAGIFIGRSMNSSSGTSGDSGNSVEREVLYWVAPMDSNFRRDEPGKSPMGMELAPVYADEVDVQPGVIKIDPTVVNNLGVRTAIVERGPLSRQIETVGYVGYDEDTLQHVHTRVDGWIERLETKASGDPVAKGQLLFEDRLAALGVNASEIARLDRERTVKQRIRFNAQGDGVIAHLGVREGIYVTPATEIMSVAQLDKIWVIAEVFERQSAWVKAGQHAMVELDYLPGKMWHGVVDYVYPELDATTRTLKVRLRFDNASMELRPNMFARVTITGDDFGDVVHVPREAVIRGGAVNRVVVALGDGRYRATPVKLGIESGDRVAIQRGLSVGDRVVTSGQFLIDSESNIEAALARMEGDTEEPAGPETIDSSDATDHSQHDKESMQ